MWLYSRPPCLRNDPTMTLCTEISPAAPRVLGLAMRVLGLAPLLLLAACGFRLAGSDPLPATLARPYLSVKDPYTDFAREFQRRLTGAGAALQPASEGASATIDVSQDLVEQ